MMRIVDLRSDTVTRPTPEMRKAMYEAEVGDDVMREDPTVRKLEEMAAERLGKEAAMLVPSGTMGNLVSLLTHCTRGDEVILGDKAHIFNHEQKGASVLGGVAYNPIPNQDDGTLRLEDIENAVQPDDIHVTRSRLLALENTHNFCGGVAIPPSYIEAAAKTARKHGLAVHLDGARIFNAATALGVSAAEIAAPVDSVMFCISKGLAAPIGSLVVGSKAFIEEARRVRKVLGGGMRQAGVIAAAGIVSLTTMVDGLHEDHRRARILAEGINQLPGLEVDLKTVQTNIVIFRLTNRNLSPNQLVQMLADRGVLLFAIGKDTLRAVTHYEISDEDISYALSAFKEVVTTHG
jgi:threonine aldolase